MTVNTDNVSDITTVDFLYKNVLSISEQLKIILAEHHSKYLKSKRNKDIEKSPSTPNYVTPVTQKNDLLFNDTPNKRLDGTISIETPY